MNIKNNLIMENAYLKQLLKDTEAVFKKIENKVLLVEIHKAIKSAGQSENIEKTLEKLESKGIDTKEICEVLVFLIRFKVEVDLLE